MIEGQDPRSGASMAGAPPGPAPSPQQTGPSGPAGRRGRRRRWSWAVAVVLVAGLAAAAFVLLSGDGGGGSGIVLHPAAEPGADAFTDDLDRAPAGERAIAPVDPGSVEGVGELDAAVALAGRSVVGSEPGVYGGTRDEPPCDVEALTDLLGDDGDEALADAWFGALDRGLGEHEREAYVDDLTPVRLRLDTRVTSHRYTGGRAVPHQAILQAGTAVLVDRRGLPRVRCAGGSPLAEPEPVGSGRAGEAALDVDALAENPEDAWEGFDPAAVVVVETRHVVDDFELANLTGTDPFVRPVGSRGRQDRGVFRPEERPDPSACEQDCHELRITVETVGGTPAGLTWEGTGEPTSQTPTSLVWGPGAAEAGTYRYDVHHAWEFYRALVPGQPTDPGLYDDPAHDDESLILDVPDPSAPAPQMPELLECVPGEVTITVTVDGAVAESTTEHVPCTGVERSFVLE